MPIFLCDTNHIGAMARNHPVVANRLRTLPPNSLLMTCFITMGEWEYGIRNAPGEAKQREIRVAGEPVFALMSHIYESDPETARAFGEIMGELRAAGLSIPTNDVWIAAVARVHSAVVVTTDAHFTRVAGLIVEDWT